MKHIKVLGIDLVKDIFQHGADSRVKKVLEKRLSRPKLTPLAERLQKFR